VFLGFSLFMLYAFGYETLYQRLTTQLEGAVVSSHDVHSPNNPRYLTKYVAHASPISRMSRQGRHRVKHDKPALVGFNLAQPDHTRERQQGIVGTRRPLVTRWKRVHFKASRD